MAGIAKLLRGILRAITFLGILVAISGWISGDEDGIVVGLAIAFSAYSGIKLGVFGHPKTVLNRSSTSPVTKPARKPTVRWASWHDIKTGRWIDK